MALKLGELVAYLRTDNTGLRRGLRQGEVETRESGERMGRSITAAALSASRAWLTSWAHASSGSRQAHRLIHRDIDATRDRIRRLAAEWARTGNESLLGDLDRERSKLDSLNRAARDLGAGGFGAALQGAQSFAGAAIGVVSSVGSLITVLLILAGVLATINVTGYLVGGMLGALPGLITGGIAAVAALTMGFWGLADAFQDSAAGGGSVVDRARQIALAERQLADANREATEAQEALTRARADAVERMADLARNLAGARLDEESAILAVQDARRDLDEAIRSGDPDRIRRADLAYRRAQQALAEVRDRVEDLQREQDETHRRGVEGSDQVRAALERQRQATQSVADAQYELRRAQTMTMGGAAKQTTELAASAAATVAMMKSLRGQYSELRLAVQQRLFLGVASEIKSLSDSWLPTLRTRLVGMAAMFNGLFKSWAATSRKPEFVANIAAGWLSVERLIDRVGKSIAGPGLESFGTLSRAAGPMIDAIGDGLAGIVDDFGAWIDQAEKSGDLEEFFRDAGDFFRDTIDMGKDVAGILGSIISIVLDAGDDNTESAFDQFGDGLEAINKWLKDPTNRDRIRDWIQQFYDFIAWTRTEAIPAVLSWIDWLQRWADRIGGWIRAARDFGAGVRNGVDTATNAISGMPERIRNAARGLFSPLVEEFRGAINAIIRRWNNLSFTIGGGTLWGQDIPSFTLHTPDIPYLAQGGWIPPTQGGRLAVLAEAGQPEWALPDAKLRAALDEAVMRGRAGGDGAAMGDHAPEIHVYIGDRELTDMVRVEVRETARQTRRRVLAGV